MSQNVTNEPEATVTSWRWLKPAEAGVDIDWVATLERHRAQLAQAEATLAVQQAEVELLRRSIKPLEELAALVTGGGHADSAHTEAVPATISTRRKPRVAQVRRVDPAASGDATRPKRKSRPA